MDVFASRDIEQNFEEVLSRRAARAAQREVELQRLMDHLQVARELSRAAPSERRERIDAAKREVERWETDGLCSADYIARWREWLELPVPHLVLRMCSDAQGWGPAMRQNSPLTGSADYSLPHRD
jgi:hypothetical protein